MSSAGEQLTRDKSPGDEVIRLRKAELYGLAFLFIITLEPSMPKKNSFLCHGNLLSFSVIIFPSAF